MRVEGHTDNRGTEKHNLKLSQDRAASVRTHLISVGGIDASRLDAQGFGLTKPIAPNKTSKGRAANRRSEFMIVERAPAAEAPPAGQTPPVPPPAPAGQPPAPAPPPAPSEAKP